MINSSLLKGRIYSTYGSQAAFTEELNWPKNKVGRILKGIMIPSIADCNCMSTKLGLNKEDYIEIFMPNLSPNGDGRRAKI
ncbi:hypothetical protein [Ruminiclostridium cellobioparum]|uniref:hypothetical protein n=1 Tax=Ruminiclostridium cellobioparum TaxID=29355 RepID=UPI0028AD0E4A|nr:hypothetical protein [Ruminiclostridium cellobioparum]